MHGPNARVFGSLVTNSSVCVLCSTTTWTRTRVLIFAPAEDGTAAEDAEAGAGAVEPEDAEDAAASEETADAEVSRRALRTSAARRASSGSTASGCRSKMMPPPPRRGASLSAAAASARSSSAVSPSSRKAWCQFDVVIQEMNTSAHIANAPANKDSLRRFLR